MAGPEIGKFYRRFGDWIEGVRPDPPAADGLFALLAEAPVGIALVSGESGRIHQVNATLCRMLGYSAAELSRRTLTELGHPEDAPSTRQAIALANHAGEACTIQVEKRYRHRAGHPVWVLVSGSPLGRDEEGESYFLCHLVDISERKQAETRLAASEERYRSILESTQEGLWEFDAELRITHANARMAEMLGVPAHALVGTCLHEYVFEEDALLVAERERQRREGTGSARYEFRFRRRDGSELWALVSVTSRHDAEGRYAGGFSLLTDITERRRARQRLAHLAAYDQLTELPNRDAFRSRLDAALIAATGGRPSVLMLLDMDNFKSVNDSLGHDAGDELLKVMAERLVSTVRPGDLVARLSGDEFTVLIEDIEDEREVAVVAGRILTAFDEPVSISGQELFLSASLGVARIPADGDSAASALKAADMAMYAAKRESLGGYRLFRPAMAERARARLRISSELHRAVTRGELEIHYQPQLALPDQTLASLEALVRWRHRDRGLLMPRDFVGVAEESGLIVELGEWVLRCACHQLAEWSDRGLAIPRLAVNVSIHQLRHPGAPEALSHALADSGLRADRLQLEITESALMNPEAAASVIGQLKSTGVTIAIDDFGTGYSSLARLRRLPVDLLKIDRAFVAQADRDSEAATLVRSIVGLAHNLGMTSLAEGVERREELALLNAHGCDYAAGWLWAPAMPPTELETWARGHERMLGRAG